MLPFRARTRGVRTAAAAILALAAILAAVAIVPALRQRGGGAPGDVAATVALLSSPGAGLPSPSEERPWSGIYRGEAPVSERGRAVRVGAYLVDVQLAAGSGDGRTGALADTVAMLVAGVPGGGAAAALYRSIGAGAGGAGDVRSRLADGDAAVRELLPRDAVDFGAWAEAARVAAARHDAAFFHAYVSRAVIQQARVAAWLTPEARASADDLQRAFTAPGVPRWVRVERAVVGLLRQAAR